MLTPYKVTIGDSFLMFLLIKTDQVAAEVAALKTKFKAVVDIERRTIELIS